jgi:hypothetical protein
MQSSCSFDELDELESNTPYTMQFSMMPRFKERTIKCQFQVFNSFGIHESRKWKVKSEAIRDSALRISTG